MRRISTVFLRAMRVRSLSWNRMAVRSILGDSRCWSRVSSRLIRWRDSEMSRRRSSESNRNGGTQMAWSTGLHRIRTRVRRWAYDLPDGLVIVIMLLIGLAVVCLLTGAIGVILVWLVRLAGVHENDLGILAGILLVLLSMLVLPLLFINACVLEFLDQLVGTRCPSCRRRELEWQSGTWKYGDPPAYHYFECTVCGARFRKLYGGKGELSDFERVSTSDRSKSSARRAITTGAQEQAIPGCGTRCGTGTSTARFAA